jgi:hypothetical protein
MAGACAMVLAGVGFAPRVGQSARRWRSLGFGGANGLGSSASARPGIPASRRHAGAFLFAGPAGTTGGTPHTVASGPLAW